MTLTGNWVKDPAGTLVLNWTAGEAPVRHRRKPPHRSQGRHRD